MKIHTVALVFIATLLAGSSGLQGAEPPFWDSNPNDAVRWEGRVAVKVINPSDFARPRELVAPKVGELGLPANVNANSLRVVDPQAAPDEPGEVGGNDLPCQVDDLDGDRKLSGDDELAFQLDLA
ncbi:MAG: hypothetical protein FJ279_34975, partial [Planctomycetes bacterium]|nr:hypothetical protein [Planctomycetota bacterium]